MIGNAQRKSESKLIRDPYGGQKYGHRDYDQLDQSKGVLIKNLVGALSKVKESDLRGFFSAFGEILNIDIDEDPVSGQNRGQAIVQFNRSDDAKAAIQKMSGFIISDIPIIVSKLPHHLTYGFNNEAMGESIKPLNSGLARAYLASKLAGNASDPQLTQKPELTEFELLEKEVKKDKCWSFDETRMLGLFNLVDPEKMKAESPKYLEDILIDVEGKLNSRMLKIR